MATGLRFGHLGPCTKHLCVDMQGIFTGNSPWAMPWFDRVLPNIHKLVSFLPSGTIFTRFIPADTPASAGGSWSRYYRTWYAMTLEHLEPGQIDLVPELAKYVPPAAVVDKRVYSPWYSGELQAVLARSNTDTLIVSGGETDVCVLASVLGAIDVGYRVIVATDAVCSSSDETHDAIQVFFGQRLSQQVETAETAEIVEAWQSPLLRIIRSG